MPSSRQLVVFDFDETIVSVCTMRQLSKFLPLNRRPPSYDFAKLGWVEYANDTFKELKTMGYTPETLCRFTSAIPPIPGMLKFIRNLWSSNQPQYDLILISDCFRYFLFDWLKKHKIFNCFTGIYCNPSKLTACGKLVVSGYHCADCPYSPPNMCKRRVLEEFLAMQRNLRIRYDRVIFIGNGRHDFCPSLDMRACDLMCARKHDVLAERLDENRKKLKIKTEIFLWADGFDLIAKVEQNVSQMSLCASSKR